MRVAREGVPFVLGFLLGGAGLAIAARTLLGFAWSAALLSGLPGFLPALFSLWFFRDPERTVPAGEGLVVAPADGRVVAVRREPEGPSLAIFLSIFDVHVNRSPIAGQVRSVVHRQGRFLAAFDQRAGDVNERNEIVVEGSAGAVRMHQVAGAIARRIVCRVKPGDRLAVGERVGLIRFGSRTDLRLPPGSELLAEVGDRVTGGLTIVGRMPVSEEAVDHAREEPQAVITAASRLRGDPGSDSSRGGRRDARAPER